MKEKEEEELLVRNLLTNFEDANAGASTNDLLSVAVGTIHLGYRRRWGGEVMTAYSLECIWTRLCCESGNVSYFELHLYA